MEGRKYDSPLRDKKVTEIVYNGENADEDLFMKLRNGEKPAKSCYNIYWGELHGHSNLSDGIISPDEYFLAARDKARLDFCALTDHDHGGVGKKELWGGKWDIVCEKVSKYYEAEKFVTILGYERDSYPWYNNLVIYYKNEKGELFRGNIDGQITREELEEILKREDIIAVPHTTSVMPSGTDFDSIPLELMTPLIEVYSKWGAEEYFGNPYPANIEARGGFWRDALEKGARMGCMAGSDEHGPNPGMKGKTVITGNLRYENPGLTAVLAENLTREAIFDAVKAKRCYASTGARILIDFRINGSVMGSEIKVRQDERRSIYMSIEGESSLSKIYLVKNGADYIIYNIDGSSDNFTDLMFDYKAKRDTDYYYLRIKQMDGRMAWTSPIWISKDQY